MNHPHGNDEPTSPVRQADQILTISPRRLRCRERTVTLLWAFLPFPLLSALIGGGAAVVVNFCRRLVQDLLHDRYVSALDVLFPGVVIALGSLAVLAYGNWILTGLAHLLRHRSIECLAQYWRNLADR